MSNSKIPPVPNVISSQKAASNIARTNSRFGYSRQLQLFTPTDVKLKKNMFGRKIGNIVQLEIAPNGIISVLRDSMICATLSDPKDFTEGIHFIFV